MKPVVNITKEQVERIVEENKYLNVRDDVGKYKSYSDDETLLWPTYVSLDGKIPEELYRYLRENKESYSFATIWEWNPNVGMMYEVESIETIMERILNEETWNVPYASCQYVRYKDGKIELEEKEALTLNYYDV